MEKATTGVKDFNGKSILEGDVLADNVPSKGIVVYSEGQFVVTSDYQGRDIRQISNSDLLDEDLIVNNRMVVIGNIHDNPNCLMNSSAKSERRIIMTEKVLQDIKLERQRQDDKWGKQDHDYPTWMTILVEEVGEVAQAMQTERGWGKESDADDLYTELIHVAAVATAIAEQVKENGY